MPLLITIAMIAVLAPAEMARGVNPSFSDYTNAAGVSMTFTSANYSNNNYSGGGTVGDFNNDGYQDIFVLSGGNTVGVPDRLYINNGDGTFTDQAALWGVDVRHSGKGASVGDFNDDGWLDIYVTSAGPPGGTDICKHKLYRNNPGSNSFTEMAMSAGVHCTTTSGSSGDGWGSTWGDYDLDGDQDLFVASFASGNAGSKLFRNNGNDTFTNVTGTISLFSGVPQTYGFAPRFLDMDGDWYPELLLVADFGTSRYFKNDGDGTFTYDNVTTNWAQDENGMGQTVGDFNNDLAVDSYVCSIYRAPGEPLFGSWTGNKLYLNNGNGVYSEEAGASGGGWGCYDGGYGWGAVGCDFNHDGLEDIAETNGHNSPGLHFQEQTYLWVNNGNDTFTEMAVASGLIHNMAGRGMSRLDLENDGDQDLVIFAADGDSVMVFRNDLSGEDTNWLRVFLNTVGDSTKAPFGVGSRVIVTVDGDSQLRYLTSGDNFLSHSELSAHFGLGAATLVDELRVEWTDGTTTSITNLAANQTITVTPGATGADFALPGTRGEPSLEQNEPNPFGQETIIGFSLPSPMTTSLKIYDVSGREVATLVDGTRAAGTYRVSWNGRDSDGRSVAPGIYFYRLRGDGVEKVRKLTYTR